MVKSHYRQPSSKKTLFKPRGQGEAFPKEPSLKRIDYKKPATACQVSPFFAGVSTGAGKSNSPITISLLPSLYSKAYRLNASHLGQRYSSILYRKPLATGVYRLLKWDTSAGLLDYPEAAKYESGKTLDVVALKILLPVRTEIASSCSVLRRDIPFRVDRGSYASCGTRIGAQSRRLVIPSRQAR